LGQLSGSDVSHARGSRLVGYAAAATCRWLGANPAPQPSWKQGRTGRGLGSCTRRQRLRVSPELDLADAKLGLLNLGHEDAQQLVARVIAATNFHSLQ